MNIADLHRRVSVSELFIPEYKLILEYAKNNNIPIPSQSQNILNNNKIKELILLGIWEGIDLFYFFRQDCDSAFAKINWKNPNQFYLFNSNPSNEPTFSINNGFVGGATLSFNTGYNILNSRINVGANNAFIAHKCFNIPSVWVQNAFIAGGRIANNNNQILLQDNNNLNTVKRVFAISALSLSQSDENSNFITYKNPINLINIHYINGVFSQSTTSSFTNASNLPNVNLYILGSNTDNVISPSGYNFGMEYFIMGQGTAIEGKEFDFNQIITQ